MCNVNSVLLLRVVLYWTHCVHFLALVPCFMLNSIVRDLDDNVCIMVMLMCVYTMLTPPYTEFIQGVSQFSVKGEKEKKLRCECHIPVFHSTCLQYSTTDTQLACYVGSTVHLSPAHHLPFPHPPLISPSHSKHSCIQDLRHRPGWFH